MFATTITGILLSPMRGLMQIGVAPPRVGLRISTNETGMWPYKSTELANRISNMDIFITMNEEYREQLCSGVTGALMTWYYKTYVNAGYFPFTKLTYLLWELLGWRERPQRGGEELTYKDFD